MAATSAPDDLAALLGRVALGDQAAYRGLYVATSAKLFAVALRILRDQGRAEEVVQDAFVNIWGAARSYNVRLSAPMTWMITIVRNRCLDYLRRHDRGEVELDDDLLNTLESDGVGPDRLLDQAQNASALKACLERLEPGQRQAIAFAYYQGLSHSELAVSLKVPIGTVKTWIRRGLLKLKTCLGGEVLE